MFDEECSVYADALDNKGRFVDTDTGECIQQMTIRDFCLTDKWKPYVEKLRAMRLKYGGAAKKMPEYIYAKKKLPGATISGLFSLYEDESLVHPGKKVMVSRRESHLLKHTGWLAIDIDFADNRHLTNFENIRFVCQFRPEIALLMHSCSGSGYFGLVRLAYPERHKEQFSALLKDYAAIGVTIDKQCGNIGRVRFASWDDEEHIYINENFIPYTGLAQAEQSLVPLQNKVHETFNSDKSNIDGKMFWQDGQVRNKIIELAVSDIVGRAIDITDRYDDWCKVGWALKGHPYGESLFYEISAVSKKYKYQEAKKKWQQLGQNKIVTENYLIHVYKTLFGDSSYRNLKDRVWRDFHT